MIASHIHLAADQYADVVTPRKRVPPDRAEPNFTADLTRVKP